MGGAVWRESETDGEREVEEKGRRRRISNRHGKREGKPVSGYGSQEEESEEAEDERASKILVEGGDKRKTRNLSGHRLGL